MRGPVRTCIGCGRRRPQSQLLRLERRSDGHVLRAAEPASGRGAYVCASRRCALVAATGRGARRSFKTTGAVHFDPEVLWPQLRDGVLREFRRLDNLAVFGAGGRKLKRYAALAGELAGDPDEPATSRARGRD